MSDNKLFGLTAAEWVVLIAAITSSATSIISAIRSGYNGQKIDKVHKEINGRVDQLITTTRDASHAEGILKGKEELLCQQTINPPHPS